MKKKIAISRHKSSIHELEVLAKKKEVVRRKLVESAAELASIAQEKEDSRTATLNLLEDLSAEKAKVEMVRAKEEAILLSIGDGLIATDPDGNITLINKAAEKLLGLGHAEVIGKVYTEVISVEDEKGHPIAERERPVGLALSAGKTTTTSATSGPTPFYVRKDKTKFPVAYSVSPVVLAGKVIGAIVVFRDVTKEQAVDRAKTEFVSLASHQLRTPLTAISWYTEMMLNDDVGPTNEAQRKYLEEIYRGDKRMIDLVNTLLNVSRIELGTFVIEPKETDVSIIAQSALDEQKLKIEIKKLTITTKFDKNIPQIVADPKLLRIVFDNLLSNAVDYTPPGGKIELTVSAEDKKNVLIKVSDTGYGIPTNQQDKIFTKLFRADNVRVRDTDGTGLGLYMVKSIIQNSGGKVWFESEENKGTTFYVTLPLGVIKKAENSN